MEAIISTAVLATSLRSAYDRICSRPATSTCAPLRNHSFIQTNRGDTLNKGPLSTQRPTKNGRRLFCQQGTMLPSLLLVLLARQMALPEEQEKSAQQKPEEGYS